MLLPPPVECEPLCFPTIEQLSGVERQALHDELPRLLSVVDRASRRCLGDGVHVESGQVLWRPAELRGLAASQGPGLVVTFGEVHQLVLRLDRPLACATTAALLGGELERQEQTRELTTVDMAILQSYLQAVAAALVRAAFHSNVQQTELLSPEEDAQLLAQADKVALVFPMRLGPVSGTMQMVAPAEAWRATLRTAEPVEQRLTAHQLGHMPVRLEAFINGASVSLAEMLALEPGDVIPLPQGEQMAVQVLAGPCMVAVGRAGAQGERLAVHLTSCCVAKEA